MEGVADPKRTFALCNDPNTILQSRALYLGDGSYCLKVPSCSSSTIMRPKSLYGKNIDDRAPKMILNRFGSLFKT